MQIHGLLLINQPWRDGRLSWPVGSHLFSHCKLMLYCGPFLNPNSRGVLTYISLQQKGLVDLAVLVCCVISSSVYYTIRYFGLLRFFNFLALPYFPKHNISTFSLIMDVPIKVNFLIQLKSFERHDFAKLCRICH